MSPDKGDWYHLVPDEVVLRRFEDQPLLRCLCCGTAYRRGFFQCCKPRAGMASHVWLAMSCPMPDQGGCGKCVLHCQCPSKAARLGTGPLKHLAEQFVVDVKRKASGE